MCRRPECRRSPPTDVDSIAESAGRVGTRCRDYPCMADLDCNARFIAPTLDVGAPEPGASLTFFNIEALTLVVAAWRLRVP
jgi:hypothetical protein